MSNIEKIKAEIERLKTTNPSEYNYKNAEGYIWAMNDLLAFIDSLPEEKPLTVEDIKTIIDISFWNDDPEKILDEYNRLCDTSKVTRR